MATYIKIDTLEYPVTEQELRQRFPHSSFSKPFTPPEGYAAVAASPRPADSHTVNVAEGKPQLTNGIWVQRWVTVPAKQEQVEFRSKRQAEAVRTQRNAKLAASDWTQLPDVPGQNRVAWAAYRQVLRDLPAQEGFPWQVDWPVAPGEVTR